MKTLSLSEVQALIQQVRDNMLGSNDIVNRKEFPYYYSHPSVPPVLTLYKIIMSEYRSASAGLVAEYGRQLINGRWIDFSQGTFFNIFITALVVSSLGIGDCADHVIKLAELAILQDAGELFFVNINFSNNKPGMEMGHSLLILNAKNSPITRPDMGLQDFLKLLPRNTIVADPFLGIAFKPTEIPSALRAYILAYGGTAVLSASNQHLKLSADVLKNHYLPRAQKILKKIKTEQLVSGEKLCSLSFRQPLENITAIVALLNNATQLSFQGYGADTSSGISVDAIAVINNKPDRKAAIELWARLGLPETSARFARDDTGKQIFILHDVNETSMAELITAELKNTYRAKVGMINVDFKWQKGKLYLLELGDAINSSGYRGYNALYGRNFGDEVMLRQIISFLQKRFVRVFFILNGLPQSYWPTAQVTGATYFNTIFDFLQFTKTQSAASFKADIVLFGENHSGRTALTSRNAAELQVWLEICKIDIPVLNAPSLIDAADDKFIFKRVMRSTPQTFLVHIKSLLAELISRMQQCSDMDVVLKPYDGTQGIGVLIFTKAEVVQHAGSLQNYFNQPDSARQIPVFLDKYRSNKCQELHKYLQSKQQNYLLLQSYISSDPIEHKGQHFDATGRMVVFLRKDISGNCEVEPIDGYWKLPAQSVEQGGASELARLSHVSKDEPGRELQGVTKFTPEQSIEIRHAFRLLTNEFGRLLESKIDFYLASFNKLSAHEKSLMNRFFKEQTFDIIKTKHYSALNQLVTSTPELGIILVRTLNAELYSFVNLFGCNPHATRFLQTDLLNYLADENCPVNFQAVVYEGEEKTALLTALSPLQKFPDYSENTALLLKKISSGC